MSQETQKSKENAIKTLIKKDSFVFPDIYLSRKKTILGLKKDLK